MQWEKENKTRNHIGSSELFVRKNDTEAFLVLDILRLIFLKNVPEQGRKIPHNVTTVLPCYWDMRSKLVMVEKSRVDNHPSLTVGDGANQGQEDGEEENS